MLWISWIFIDFHRCSLIFIDVTYIFMDFYRFSWISIDLHIFLKFSWISEDFHGFLCRWLDPIPVLLSLVWWVGLGPLRTQTLLASLEWWHIELNSSMKLLCDWNHNYGLNAVMQFCRRSYLNPSSNSAQKCSFLCHCILVGLPSWDHFIFSLKSWLR